ncbi:MAG: DUF5711 family protein, partial [Oscillospiraceae bacterium]|nr:DUF5711 family protein [Oscillospiraceae bacterium]
VTDTSLTVYTESAAPLNHKSHAFATPLADTAGEYLLLAESGGRRFSLENAKETVWQGETEAAIRSGAVGPDGMVALVTASNRGYVSELLVYNSKGSLVYRWNSGDWQLIAAAVSRDGKRVAAAAVSAEQGRLQSAILVFDPASDSDDPISCCTGYDNMLFALRYMPDGNIVAVGSDAVWTFISSGGNFSAEGDNVLRYPFSDWKLDGYALSGSGAALALSRYGSAGRSGDIVWINSSGSVVCQTEFTGAYRSVAVLGDSFCLLTVDRLTRLTQEGLSEGVAVPGDGIMAAAMGSNHVAVLGLTQVEVYEVKGK